MKRLHSNRLVVGRGVLFAVIVAICVSPESGYAGRHRFTSPNGSAGDEFGFSVSVYDSVALVGAPNEDCAAGDFCGAAYVYRFDGTSWNLEQTLTASDAPAGAQFGYAVAVARGQSDRLVVGAPGVDTVYVFQYNGSNWVEEQKIVPSGEGGFFGGAVSIVGPRLLVGAKWTRCESGQVFCGAAYVFVDFGPWIEQQKLTASDGVSSDYFGNSVFLSTQTAIDTAWIGTQYADCAAGEDCGAVYLFESDDGVVNWNETQKLVASQQAAEARFGSAIAVGNNRAFIGSYWQPCLQGGDCGSVYLFRPDGSSWLEVEKIDAADGESAAWFGYSLSYDAFRLTVGVPMDNDHCSAGQNCGAVHWLRQDNFTLKWVEDQQLPPTALSGNHRFGHSVSSHGDTILVGAPKENTAAGGVDSGAAYVFSCGQGPCLPTIPAVSNWGLLVLIILVLTAGTLAARKQLRVSR